MRALILAGGSGTRFWPASRRARPKQLLPLEGGRSLLQATLDRLRPLVDPARTWVCTSAALTAEVARQLPELPAGQVLAEPVGRNTAPAIGWSVRSMPAEARSEVVVVLPADHRVEEAEPFRAALARAAAAVERHDLVVALGVTPHRAETGYGYLELAGPHPAADGLLRVARFVEKPDAATAERFLASGRHLWNAGIFLFKGTTLLALLAEHQPELAADLAAIAAAPQRLAELYPRLPDLSIDYGLMEKLSGIATLALDCGWSDLGSWQALAEELPADAAGNAVHGDTLALDAGSNLLFADSGTIAVLGVEGLVVVKSGDAVLVLPRERSQEVRRIVAALEAAGRSELL